MLLYHHFTTVNTVPSLCHCKHCVVVPSLCHCKHCLVVPGEYNVSQSVALGPMLPALLAQLDKGHDVQVEVSGGDHQVVVRRDRIGRINRASNIKYLAIYQSYQQGVKHQVSSSRLFIADRLWTLSSANVACSRKRWPRRLTHALLCLKISRQLKAESCSSVSDSRTRAEIMRFRLFTSYAPHP